MARKIVDKETVTNNNVEAEYVLVKVDKAFRDATDNNRDISAGPNSYYRTTKERADMLVTRGFCSYDDKVNSNVVVDEQADELTVNNPTQTNDDNSNPNE